MGIINRLIELSIINSKRKRKFAKNQIEDPPEVENEKVFSLNDLTPIFTFVCALELSSFLIFVFEFLSFWLKF